MRRWTLTLVMTVAAIVGLWLAIGSQVPAQIAKANLERPARASAPGQHARERGRASARTPSEGRRVVAGAWGAGPGQFGRRDGAEADAEGPLSFAVAGDEVLVLDQVNGRVQRFGRDGALRGELRIGPDTARDVAVDPSGRIAVLDRDGEGEVLLYGADGQPLASAPLQGGSIDEPGDVTAVFADAGGVYVERAHEETVRVIGPDGRADGSRQAAPGRPSRDGSRRLQASIVDAAAGRAVVRTLDPDGRLIWQRPVTFARPIVHLLLLDSDAAGNVYFAAFVANESPSPPYELLNEAIVVVRLAAADGAPSGSLVLGAHDGPEEVAEELQVGDDGTIYQLHVDAAGLSILAHSISS